MTSNTQGDTSTDNSGKKEWCWLCEKYHLNAHLAHSEGNYDDD